MTTMRMIVGMLVVRVVVVMATVMIRAVRVGTHCDFILRALGSAWHPSPALIGQFDTAPRELIDALASGCDHETSFPLPA
jgi:hypothetical protein